MGTPVERRHLIWRREKCTRYKTSNRFLCVFLLLLCCHGDDDPSRHDDHQITAVKEVVTKRTTEVGQRMTNGRSLPASHIHLPGHWISCWWMCCSFNCPPGGQLNGGTAFGDAIIIITASVWCHRPTSLGQNQPNLKMEITWDLQVDELD